MQSMSRKKAPKTVKTEALVIGTGVAGLATALKLADTRQVLLVAKCEAQGSNTAMPQGGIASVMASDDDFSKHIADTLHAGDGVSYIH